jgi:plasmid stability protein
MPTAVLEDVPAELSERIRQLAAAHNRSLPAEVVRLLRQGLREEGETQPAAQRPPDGTAPDRLADPASATAAPPTFAREPRPAPVPAGHRPDLPALSEEVAAPCDLPRPGTPRRPSARAGARRLPDPLVTHAKEAQQQAERLAARLRELRLDPEA